MLGNSMNLTDKVTQILNESLTQQHWTPQMSDLTMSEEILMKELREIVHLNAPQDMFYNNKALLNRAQEKKKYGFGIDLKVILDHFVNETFQLRLNLLNPVHNVGGVYSHMGHKQRDSKYTTSKNIDKKRYSNKTNLMRTLNKPRVPGLRTLGNKCVGGTKDSHEFYHDSGDQGGSSDNNLSSSFRRNSNGSNNNGNNDDDDDNNNDNNNNGKRSVYFGAGPFSDDDEDEDEEDVKVDEINLDDFDDDEDVFDEDEDEDEDDDEDDDDDGGGGDSGDDDSDYSGSDSGSGTDDDDFDSDSNFSDDYQDED